jgi:hypothetical protein
VGQTALYNIGRNYLQGTDNTQNDAAARGIFQSSIKDGALADLAATKATMSSDVNTRVNNAQVFHDAPIKRINDWWTNFQEGMNAIKVTNAAEPPTRTPGPGADRRRADPRASRRYIGHARLVHEPGHRPELSDRQDDGAGRRTTSTRTAIASRSREQARPHVA